MYFLILWQYLEPVPSYIHFSSSKVFLFAVTAHLYQWSWRNRDIMPPVCENMQQLIRGNGNFLFFIIKLGLHMLSAKSRLEMRERLPSTQNETGYKTWLKVANWRGAKFNIELTLIQKSNENRHKGSKTQTAKIKYLTRNFRSDTMPCCHSYISRQKTEETHNFYFSPGSFYTSSHSFLMGNIVQFFTYHIAKHLYSGEKSVWLVLCTLTN